MSEVYFNSDLHLAHSNILKFADGFRAKCMGVSTVDEHDQMIYDLWSDTIRKRDVIYILGDVGFDISQIKKLPGHKKLLLGNHDELHAREYLEVFDDIVGPIKYKRHWISHFPIHETELWYRPVIHGHTHSTGVEHEMYINVCVEFTRGRPVSYQDIKSGKYYTHDKVNKPFETINWS